MYTVNFIAELFNLDAERILYYDKKYKKIFSLYKEEMTIEEKVSLKIRRNKKVYKYSIKAVFAFAMILPENDRVKDVLNIFSNQMTFETLFKCFEIAKTTNSPL